jgi:hypothetical protein
MADADRRGRRASWIAVILFIVLCVLSWPTLTGWYRQERYVRLREHQMRRNRFAIEDVIREADPRTRCGLLIVTIDELKVGEWEATDATRTLDSLATIGRHIRIRDLPDGDVDAVRSLITPLAERARNLGYASAAVIGSELSAADAAVLGDLFGTIRNDLPHFSGFLREGEASWVSLEAVHELSAPVERPLFLWLRYTELSKPHLAHQHFDIPEPRTSELVAIDHYLGRVLRFIWAVGCGERMRLLVTTSEPTPGGHLDGWLIGAGASDTVSIRALPGALGLAP